MRQRREALGISQGRLGRHLGLTFSQIQKYEKGANRIGAGRLYQIATFLGVPPSYFFEGLDGASGRQPPAERRARATRSATLNEAFAAIHDAETRASVLALSARSPPTPTGAVARLRPSRDRAARGPRRGVGAVGSAVDPASGAALGRRWPLHAREVQG